jgi:hypothetical protein
METVQRARGGARLPEGVAALARIGEALERSWAARGYRRQCFHDIAAEVLSAASFHQQFDEEEIIGWVNRAASLPRQLDPRSSFGQPPLTVWGTDRFVLDLYFWVDTDTSVHDHSFSGAFTNLSGHSLNCAYRFEHASRADEGIRTGSLMLDRAEYVKPGDVCAIVAGPKFIHRVWHLDCPTVTLVARTITRTRGPRQYSYYPEGLAVRYHHKPPIEFQRRRELMGYLFRRLHPRRVALAEEILARARGWQTFALLGDLVRFYMKEPDDARELEGLIARLPSRRRTWIDTGLAVMRSEYPLKSVYWRRLRRTEHRLLIALLGTYDEGRSVVEWLARHGYEGDWRATLTDWLSEMDADKALRLRLGSARAEIIAQLLRGLSDAEALRELRRTYTITDPETALLVQGFRRFRELTFLKPLLEPGLHAAAGGAALGAALV